MSAAETADRIVAGRYKPTRKLGGAISDGDTRKLLEDRAMPVIVADNVQAFCEQYVQSGRSYAIGGWPCLAPPWPCAWIEYPNSTGRERRGVHMLSFDLMTATKDELGEVMTGMMGEAIRDATEQSPGQTPRWALVLVMFVDDRRTVIGPVGCTITILDEWGKELGNRWFLHPYESWVEADEEKAMWLHAALVPALQTIAFAHCKNVVIDRHRRPDKLARAYRKRHRREPLGWETVRLELPRRAGASAEPARPGTPPALHIVAGHFSHYGNCCPTSHEPKGLLFGKLEGVYWAPMHLRGDPERGEVRADRVVAPLPPDQP